MANWSAHITEAEWLAGHEPGYLFNYGHFPGSERKRRLFCCACCRRIEALLHGESLRELETAERYAEVGVSREEHDANWTVIIKDDNLREGHRWNRLSTSELVMGAVKCAKVGGWTGTTSLAAYIAARALNSSVKTEHNVQTELLRCIVGNPFRPAPVIAKGCLTPDVTSLAQSIYDLRSFDRLPELAAALEAGGCTDAVLLEHLNGPGPHALGCWGLDAILQKS